MAIGAPAEQTSQPPLLLLVAVAAVQLFLHADKSAISVVFYINDPIHDISFGDTIFFVLVLACVGCTMEMVRSGNGGGKVVTFDDAITGRRRNGSSLSSYLDMGRDRDADGGRAAPRPLPAHAMASRRRTYADGELDVFAAERYFRGAMDGDGDRKEGFSVSVTTPAVAVQVQPWVETAAARPAAAEAVVMAKPSSTRASTVSFAASSASSTANSQTALFRGGLRRRRSSRDSRCCVQVGVLMRTCSGKRSVRVDGGSVREAPDSTEPAAATGIDWYRELRMHKAALGLSGDGNSHRGLVAAGLPPPSLNLGTAKVAAIGREVAAGEHKEAAERTSMRRRNNFTLVAPVRASVPASGGRVGEPGGAGKGGRGGGADRLHDADDDDDDAGSESSSDLFEIKSLMRGECPYEPSEASIQWSVVTADASERGDRIPAARWVGSGARGPPVAGRQVRGHRPAGILAGCASHRAVDVSAAAAATTKAVPNAVAMQQRRGEGFHKARNGA